MCGIAGYASPAAPPGLAGDVLERMAGALLHRGPDEDGTYRDDRAGLAIRRLQVMDPAGGQQPVTDEGGRYQVVYNGEIYNFIELRADLEARGHRFRSRGDTEVIVHAYEEFGPDCVLQFNGMFAFAVWDTRERTLFLARDRLGIKPLHYCLVGGTLVFGSEIKAVLEYPGVERRLDLAAFDRYLTFEYVPAPHTIFEGVRKLLAGEWLLWDGRDLQRHRYWELPSEVAPARRQADWEDELRRRIQESVRRMLVADVPLGLFLSGGIDSSTLVAFATQLNPGRIKTFSIGFADRSFDESAYARQVAAHFGTQHEEEILEAPNLGELLPSLMDVLDEPLGDASIVPTYLLSRLTRRHVTVALSGEGGDELFAGYPTYQAAALARHLRHVPRVLVAAAGRAAQALPVNTANISLDFKLKRFFSRLHHPPDERHILWVGSFGGPEKQRLLLPEVRDRLQETSLWEPLQPLRRPGADAVDQALRLDLQLYLADDLLVKLDRASMAVSLEGRVPFLDHTLVEFAASMPLHLKLRGFTTKHILKAAMRGLLPSNIIRRPKKGFGIPVARWSQGPLRSLLQDALHPDRVSRWNLVDPAEVQRLLQEHQEGRFDHRKLLWTLLIFSLWWDRWMQ